MHGSLEGEWKNTNLKNEIKRMLSREQGPRESVVALLSSFEAAGAQSGSAIVGHWAAQRQHKEQRCNVTRQSLHKSITLIITVIKISEQMQLNAMECAVNGFRGFYGGCHLGNSIRNARSKIVASGAAVFLSCF